MLAQRGTQLPILALPEEEVKRHLYDRTFADALLEGQGPKTLALFGRHVDG
jgi:hypothetical protein